MHLCTLSIAPPSLCLIAQNSKTVCSTNSRPDIEFYPNWAIYEESRDKNSFISLSEAWMSLSWISINPLSLWTCHVLDYIQIRRKMYYWGKNFIYATMYVFHCADFHETLTCSVVLPRYVLYHISPKSVKKYGKYGYKVIHVLKWSMNVPEWVFKKLCLLDNFLKRTPIMNFIDVRKTAQLLIPGHWCQTDLASIQCIIFHFLKNAWKCNYCNTVTYKAAVP